MPHKRDISKQIVNHKRHLQKLKEKLALYGSLDAPTHLLIQIEDVEKKIKELQGELSVQEEDSDEEKTQNSDSRTNDGQIRRVTIYVEGDFSTISDERKSAAITAFAAVMGISPQDINLYGIYKGSIAFELGVSSDAAQSLQNLLQSNDARLPQLKINKVTLEMEVNKIETWVGVTKELLPEQQIVTEENIEEYVLLPGNEPANADFGFRVMDNSLAGDDILLGEIALIHQQPNVKNGDIAAIVIRLPNFDIGMLKRYYVVYESRGGLAHWLLESSNPLSPHIVVIPRGADSEAIKNLYVEKYSEGTISTPVEFFENAEIIIAGKYVGRLRKKV